jgi:tetratricopeptide (TPR) repeat protein
MQRHFRVLAISVAMLLAACALGQSPVPSSQVQSLLDSASKNLRKSNLPAALADTDRAVKRASDLDDRYGLACARSWRASVLWQLDRSKEAEEEQKAALSAFEKLEDVPGQMGVLRQRAQFVPSERKALIDRCVALSASRKGRESDVAHELKLLGDVLYRAGAYDDADKLFARAYDIEAAQTKDSELLGVICYARGASSQVLQRPSESRDWYLQAKAILEKVPPTPQLANTLFELGRNCQNSNKHDEALQYFAQAKSKVDGLSDESFPTDYLRKDLLATIFLNEAWSYEALKRNREAVAASLQAIEIYEKLPKPLPMRLSHAYNTAAWNAMYMDDIDRAEALFNKAIVKFGDLDPASTKLEYLLLGNAQLLFRKKEYALAAPLYLRCYQIRAKQSPQLVTTPGTLFDYAECLRLQRRFSEAAEAYERALSGCDQVAQAGEMKLVINHSYGNALRGLGRPKEALAKFLIAKDGWVRLASARPLDSYLRVNALMSACEASTICADELKDLQESRSILLELPFQSTRTQFLLGQLDSSEGKYDQALNHYGNALALADTQTSATTVTEANYFLGVTYHILGEFDLASIQYQKTIKLAMENKVPYVLVNAVGAQGLLMTNLGRHEDALQLFGAALAAAVIVVTDPEDRKWTNCLGNIGLSYVMWSKGDYENGMKYGKEAVRLSEGVDSYTHGMAAGIYSVNLAFAGRSAEALPFIQSALKDFEQNRYDKAICICYGVMGRIYEALGEYPKAEEAYGKMEEMLARVSEQVADPSQLGSFQATLPNPYGHYAIMRHSAGNSEDALLILEKGRGWGLSRQLALKIAAESPTLLDPEDAARLRSARERVSRANWQIEKIKREGDTMRSTADALAAATQELESAEAAFAFARDRAYAANKVKQSQREAERPRNRRDFLDGLAGAHPDTLYIQYAMVDRERTLLVALSQKYGVKTFSLPIGEAALKEIVSKWQASIQQSGQKRHIGPGDDDLGDPASEKKYARELFKLVLGDVDQLGWLKKGSFERLVIVPDGPLGDIPFAALMLDDKERLVDRLIISTAVSFSSLLYNEAPSKPTKTILCVSDPTGDDRVSGPAQAAPKGRRAGYEPLPHAREEVDKVSAMFKSPTVLPGKQARESTVKDLMPDYAILHFACHGALDTANSLRTALVMAAEPEADQDGLLQAREILWLQKPLLARLAVLSACETGRGTTKGGDGIQSLAWAFQASGCESVVASHWQVNDASTADLMKMFYANLLDKMPKDKALTLAMRKLKEKEQAPFYWAAFDLIGKNTPIDIGLKR